MTYNMHNYVTPTYGNTKGASYPTLNGVNQHTLNTASRQFNSLMKASGGANPILQMNNMHDLISSHGNMTQAEIRQYLVQFSTDMSDPRMTLQSYTRAEIDTLNQMIAQAYPAGVAKSQSVENVFNKILEIQAENTAIDLFKFNYSSNPNYKLLSIADARNLALSGNKFSNYLNGNAYLHEITGPGVQNLSNKDKATAVLAIIFGQNDFEVNFKQLSTNEKLQIVIAINEAFQVNPDMTMPVIVQKAIDDGIYMKTVDDVWNQINQKIFQQTIERGTKWEELFEGEDKDDTI